MVCPDTYNHRCYHMLRTCIVPASSQKFLTKSRNLKVDCVAYDLEDSVTIAAKPEARKALRKFLDQERAPEIREQAVRINSVDSGFALNDLTEVLQATNVDTIVVPKVNSAADLHFVTDVIKHKLDLVTEQGDQKKTAPQIIALVESARSVMNLSEICKASPYLSGLIFAAEDFAADLSITRTPSLSEFLYARSALVTAARAFNIPSAIDLVCTAYKGDQGLKTLENECIQGKGMGFNGKQLIHPSQVEICQRTYAPGEKEVEWATRVVIGDEKASKQGRGAWTLDGAMIDVPVVKKAQAIVKKAELCEFDMDSIRSKWAHQEPE